MIDILKKIGTAAAVIGLIWIFVEPVSAANFVGILWTMVQNGIQNVFTFLGSVFK
jgi:hypothetical protein